MWPALVADVVVVGGGGAFQRQHGKAFVLTGSFVLQNLLKVTHRAFQGLRFLCPSVTNGNLFSGSSMNSIVLSSSLFS